MQLKNVKIINYNETINNANITIENGIISKIEKLDGEGTMTVIPGFIDSHTHGYFGRDNMGSIEDIEFISTKLKEIGTTSYLATIMTESIETMENCLLNITKANPTGSKILGIHVEGPFISHEKKGAHNEKYIINPTKKIIDDMQIKAKGMIKKMTIAPELFDKETYKSLRDNKIVMSLGHTDGTAGDVQNAINEGATSATHLWNAMTGVANRNAGVAQGVLIHSEIYAELILDLLHLDANIIALTLAAKKPSEILIVTDALAAAGLPDGEYVSGGLPVIKKGPRITVKGTDTIAGSAATMYECFKNMIKLGFKINDVVAMTSYNHACNLHIDNIGIIKEGFEADLLVLDDNFKIEQVLVSGK